MGTSHSFPPIVVSTKGQVVIPKELRDAYGWKKGDELVPTAEGDGVMLRRVGSRASPFAATTVDQVAGCLKRRGRKAVSLAAMNQAVEEAVAEKHRARR